MQPKAEAHNPFDDEAPTLRRAKLADFSEELEDERLDEVSLDDAEDDEPLTRSRRPPPLARA